MSKEITVFTKKQHLKRRNMSINRQKMKKLVSGEADTLIHRVDSLDGPIIHTYKGEQLRALLASAVMNGRTMPNDTTGRLEVEYFLAHFIDPNNVLEKFNTNETVEQSNEDVPF
jgi:hypothetical protein